jgi:serralysin
MPRVFESFVADDPDVELPSAGGCACPICFGGPQFYAPPTSGTQNGLPVLSWDQAAAQLARDGWSWVSEPGTPIAVTYAFRSSIPADQYEEVPDGVTGFAAFSAAQIQVTEIVLQLWADVANISFVRVGEGTSGPAAYSNDATMLFGNFTNGPNQFSAFAFLPEPGATGALDLNGDLWFNVQRPAVNDPWNLGLGGARLLSHEIGHTLGLLHPADYGGGAGSGLTYENDAQHWQDSAMFTNMSYFGPNNTGANFGIPAWGPMLHDIAAAQMLYGANLLTRAGDTVYGFNATADRAMYVITSASQAATCAIWDAGGNDTLDLSGYNTASEIDLRPESFSSAGPGLGGAAVYNISIARGAVIENAIGGSGADNIIGNGVVNILRGNGGNDNISGAGGNDILIGGAGADQLVGGAGFDTADYSASAVAVRVNLGSSQGLGGDAEGDRFFTIEAVIGSAFDDRFTGSANGDTFRGGGGIDTLLGQNGDDVLDGGTGADNLNGGNGNDHLIGGAGADQLSGGTGIDTVDYSASSGGVRINISANVGLDNDAQGDRFNSVEAVIGSAFNDRFTGATQFGDDFRGGDGDDTLLGQAGDDLLFGQDGADTLTGGNNNDLLDGGAGADVLNGGAGLDAFVFSSVLGAGNVDTITGFNVADDAIHLSVAVFGVAAGTLAASAFVIGAAAVDADDRIIYNTATGALFYDPDGNGAGAAVQFAQLAAGLGLTNADFFGLTP